MNNIIQKSHNYIGSSPLYIIILRTKNKLSANTETQRAILGFLKVTYAFDKHFFCRALFSSHIGIYITGSAGSKTRGARSKLMGMPPPHQLT